MAALEAYLERCGLTFDISVNVLAGGALGQTLSLRAAIAQRAGKRWAAWLCWLLGVLLQRQHCAKQFTGETAPAVVYLRAGVAFGVATASAGALLFTAWRLARQR